MSANAGILSQLIPRLASAYDMKRRTQDYRNPGLVNNTAGAWRSLVAHCNGVAGVGGSSPLAPTNSVFSSRFLVVSS